MPFMYGSSYCVGFLLVGFLKPCRVSFWVCRGSRGSDGTRDLLSVYLLWTNCTETSWNHWQVCSSINEYCQCKILPCSVVRIVTLSEISSLSSLSRFVKTCHFHVALCTDNTYEWFTLLEALYESTIQYNKLTFFKVNTRNKIFVSDCCMSVCNRVKVIVSSLLHLSVKLLIKIAVC